MISKEQRAMAKALAEVVKSRMDRGGMTSRIEFAPSAVNQNEIDTSPIAQALAEVFKNLNLSPQTNVVSNIDTTPLTEALLKIVEASKATEVKIDMGPVARALDRLESAMDEQSKLIQKLVNAILKMDTPTINTPKIKKSSTKVVRDKDGEMKETETKYEYEEE